MTYPDLYVPKKIPRSAPFCAKISKSKTCSATFSANYRTFSVPFCATFAGSVLQVALSFPAKLGSFLLSYEHDLHTSFPFPVYSMQFLHTLNAEITYYPPSTMQFLHDTTSLPVIAMHCPEQKPIKQTLTYKSNLCATRSNIYIYNVPIIYIWICRYSYGMASNRYGFRYDICGHTTCNCLFRSVRSALYRRILNAMPVYPYPPVFRNHAFPARPYTYPLSRYY